MVFASEGGNLKTFNGLSTEVVETILHFSAPSMRETVCPELDYIHFMVQKSPAGLFLLQY